MKSKAITNTILTKHFKTTVFLSLTLMLEFILLFPTTSVAKTTLIEAPVSANGCPATLDFNLRRLAKSEEVNLCDAYKGKVVLIVNTASKCGYTGQFDGLEALYKKYKDKGLVVLGFPSNDFANQDPENEQKIAQFCRLTYGVKFPMFQKTHAAESNASPIYKTLGGMAGEFPQWNFHKYLLDTKGNLIGSFKSQVTPGSNKIVSLIEKHLP